MSHSASKDTSLSLVDLHNELYAISSRIAGIESVVTAIANANNDDDKSNGALYLMASVAADACSRIGNVAFLLERNAKVQTPPARRSS